MSNHLAKSERPSRLSGLLVSERDTIILSHAEMLEKTNDNSKGRQKLYKIVDEAIKKLKEEVDPFSGLPVKKGRGIVNRLSSDPEIQMLCSSAIESLDLILSCTGLRMSSNLAVRESSPVAPGIRFEDADTSSVTVIIHYEDPPVGKVSGYIRSISGHTLSF